MKIANSKIPLRFLRIFFKICIRFSPDFQTVSRLSDNLKQFRQFCIFSELVTGWNPKTGTDPSVCRYICRKHTPERPAMSIALLYVFCIQIISTYRPAKIRQTVSGNKLRQNRATVLFLHNHSTCYTVKSAFFNFKIIHVFSSCFLCSINKPDAIWNDCKQFFF